MDRTLIRIVSRAILEELQAKDPGAGLETRQLLARVGDRATEDEVDEALAYLGFRSCIETTAAPDESAGVTIRRVDVDCLRRYVED
jgi:hypothetical protein